jgi:hypothetical protein
VFTWQLEAFYAILTPPIVYLLAGLPLAVLYILNILDMATGVISAVSRRDFHIKRLLGGAASSFLFYTMMWLGIFAVGLSLSAIALLNIVSFFVGGIVITISTVGIFSILCSVIFLSILDNLQEARTGKKNGFCGERQEFYNVFRKYYSRVAKQEQFQMPMNILGNKPQNEGPANYNPPVPAIAVPAFVKKDMKIKEYMYTVIRINTSRLLKTVDNNKNKVYNVGIKWRE